MEPAKIVIHYSDGKIVKGYSNDFFPDKTQFHLTIDSSDETINVTVANLKAIFFVKEFEGDPDFGEKKGFEEGQSAQGRKVRVIFQDGEALVGSVLGYNPNRQGFFLIPADPQSNNKRVFVVSKATSDLEFI